MDKNSKLYGTKEPAQVLRSVQIGSLSLLYSRDALRRICWHGAELVRGISWPVRDQNWGTYSSTLHEEQIHHDSESFAAKLRFSVANGDLDCQLDLTANQQGEVRADITMTPTNGSFQTNRAGFTVLHPVNGTAGMPLLVTHPDGETEQVYFPKLISFDQPVKNIQGLSYSVSKAKVDIAFKGEVFEMEDQRNWSDASYKTYCVPLVHPFAYTIDKPVTQSILLNCSGVATASQDCSGSALHSQLTDNVSPQIALVLEPDWIGDESLWKWIAKTGIKQIVVRTGSNPSIADMSAYANFLDLLEAELDMEIVLDNDEPVAGGLQRIADTLANTGLHPERVLALREIYMASHQPGGPWPEGATPGSVCVAARSAFPGVKIGGGMLTNFTELNRCRPETEQCDYISHANTSIVHASDDLSVIETLETLPQIFESAAMLARGKPYRLGLVSIGMRSNPYGDEVAANPKQVRCTMAREDPRQRGLFAAAWAVGVLAATQDSAVESICLAAPSGPFGIVYKPWQYPQVGYDHLDRAVFPLYHVVRTACQMKGAKRLSFNGLPDGVVAFGVQRESDRLKHAMFANVTELILSVSISQKMAIVLLDTDSFNDAVLDPDWLENTESQNVTQLELGPFAVAFASWE